MCEGSFQIWRHQLQNIPTFNSTLTTTYTHPLPKIHKPGNPGGPIILGCGSPTDRLSSFVDFHLKPPCSSLPSYIKDTNHFLQTIFNPETPLPPNTIIATIDVKSIYTNIPYNEGSTLPWNH